MNYYKVCIITTVVYKLKYWRLFLYYCKCWYLAHKVGRSLPYSLLENNISSYKQLSIHNKYE